MLKKNGQSVAEYALMITTIIIAISTMQTYVKRGLQGRMADASDEFVQGVANAPWDALTPPVVMTTQFEPAELSRTSHQDIIEDSTNFSMTTGGAVTRGVSRKVLQGANNDFQKYDY